MTDEIKVTTFSDGRNVHSALKVNMMITKEPTEKCLAIMQAALELIAEQGFHGTPMSQIANRAGVGVGSIYRYFKDKDELIHAVHARVDKQLTAALANGRTADASQKEQFINLVILLTKHLIANPLEFKFIEQYYNSPYGIEKKREKFVAEPSDDFCVSPFHDILTGDSVKDLPLPAIYALVFGPLVFGVRDHLVGLMQLDDDVINKIAEGSWDAIRKHDKA